MQGAVVGTPHHRKNQSLVGIRSDMRCCFPHDFCYLVAVTLDQNLSYFSSLGDSHDYRLQGQAVALGDWIKPNPLTWEIFFM
jgi:hypothetical protein